MAKSPFGWLEVGHWTDSAAQTGCTVVRVLGDVVASGEVRGGAPATREFALLEPTKMVESIHAVVLSGGSAFGLSAADGVARSLRAQDIGFETAHGRVPIVVAMSLYDLGVGNAMRWPGVPEGDAALNEVSSIFDVGLVGAGVACKVIDRSVDRRAIRECAQITGEQFNFERRGIVEVHLSTLLGREMGLISVVPIDGQVRTLVAQTVEQLDRKGRFASPGPAGDRADLNRW